jgi:hypothetical protein
MMKRILTLRAWDLLRPLLQAVVVAVPFAILNLGIKASAGNNPAVWIPVVTILVVSHYFVNYQLLLTDREKLYVLDRIKIGKVGTILGVTNR